MDFITGADLAGWLGVSSTGLTTRLAAVANQAVSDYLQRSEDDDDVSENAACIQATLETGALLWRNKGINPLVASMALGDGQVGFRLNLDAYDPIPATAKALLAPYRRIRIASSC